MSKKEGNKESISRFVLLNETIQGEMNPKRIAYEALEVSAQPEDGAGETFRIGLVHRDVIAKLRELEGTKEYTALAAAWEGSTEVLLTEQSLLLGIEDREMALKIVLLSVARDREIQERAFVKRANNFTPGKYDVGAQMRLEDLNFSAQLALGREMTERFITRVIVDVAGVEEPTFEDFVGFLKGALERVESSKEP